jgi:outer membrane lipoprotein-sorting protein
LIFPLLAFGQDKPELTLDQIVQKHIDALGGIDKLKAITTLSATGKATMQGGQMEAPMLMQMKRPSSMRMEITIQGKKIVQAFDGTTAWMINPMMGSDAPQKASDDDTQEMKDSADIDFSSLVNYKEKGNTVELVGTEDVEGNPTYKLKVTKKNGRVEYQYLDAKTFLPIKTTTKRKQMGTELEIDAYPSNFKPVNGVLFPYTVDQKLGGKSMIQLTLDKVDVNKPIDDATFQFPEKPKAEPKSEPKAEPKP